MNMSNYLENKLIDHLFRTSPYNKPATLAVALYTVAPTDAGGGTEVTGGSYARALLPPLNTNWNATQGGTSGDSTGTSGETENAVAITFPTPTAGWGTVVAVGIFDAASGGNLLLFGTLDIPKVINNGDSVTFQPGTLSITLN